MSTRQNGQQLIDKLCNLITINSTKEAKKLISDPFFLKHSEKLNLQNRSGHTPLIVSVMKNNEELVKVLLKKKVNINKQTRYRSLTPLHISSFHGYMGITKLLIENGANIEALNRHKWSPLHSSCNMNQIETIKLLLKYGANEKVRTVLRKRPVDLGDEKVKEFFKKRERKRKSSMNKKYSNPNVSSKEVKINKNLFKAFMEGNMDKVRKYWDDSDKVDSFRIHKSVFDPSYKNVWMNWIHYAVYFNRIEILKFLIKDKDYFEKIKGIDKYSSIHDNGVWKDYENPLHIAAKFGYEEIVSYLLQKGAEKNRRTFKGKSALQIAKNKKIKDLIKQSIQEHLLGHPHKNLENIMNSQKTEIGLLSESINEGTLLFDKKNFHSSLKKFKNALQLSRKLSNQKKELLCLRKLDEIHTELFKTLSIDSDKKVFEEEKVGVMVPESESGVATPVSDSGITSPLSEGDMIEEYNIENASYLLEKTDITIENTIASGTYGIVKSGILKVGLSSISVAVKELPMDKTDKTQIEHEIFLMSTLNHENVIKCFGCYFDRNSAFIVMELCKKGNLFDYIRKNKISKRMKLNWISGICSGMKYLHSKGLVHRYLFIVVLKHLLNHRDLKSQNILIDVSSEIKICDFGTAKQLSSFGNTFCAVEYLAPELTDTEKESDPKLIDIYSLGVLMWEIWSQQITYESLKKRYQMNQFAILTKIINENVRPSFEKGFEDAPVELVNLMNKCWEKEPEKRPQSFDEVLNVIEKLIENLKNEDETEKK